MDNPVQVHRVIMDNRGFVDANGQTEIWLACGASHDVTAHDNKILKIGGPAALENTRFIHVPQMSSQNSH